MRVAPAAALRTSTAVGVSVLAHAALLAALTGRALVKLTLAPAPIVLSFVEPAARTAGPGERAPELRIAAPAPAAAPPVPMPAPEIDEAKPPTPIPAPVPTPPKRATVEPPAPKPPVVAARPRPAAPDVPQVPSPSPAGVAGGSTGGTATATAGSGTDARSTAPAWAPTARVRYEELLFAWMERHKQYPLLAQRRGLEGRGALRVRIGRDGRVIERSLDRSTGEAMLDQAALDMVRRANPFPAVPFEYSGESFEFVAPIEYRLR